MRRARHAVLPSGVRPSQVLLLAAVSILTHPILDTLNTYGVRWLMPVRGDWFYGDTLFIADPWLWLVLALGVASSRRAARSRGYMAATTRPARIGLVVGAAYVVGMLLAGVAARGIARGELEAPDGARWTPDGGAAPGDAVTRSVVALQGGAYRVGSFHWFRRPHVDMASLRTFPAARPDDPPVLAARGTTPGRRFLGGPASSPCRSSPIRPAARWCT